MAKVVWRPAALADLNDIVDYIEQFNESAALQVWTSLVACGESLAAFPRRGRPAGDGLREMVTVPPYILRYAVGEDEIVHIVEVRHGRQRPRT